MLTDGALRMLVLLHFHTLGFNAGAAGPISSCSTRSRDGHEPLGGWIAARFGLTSTLYAGLALQVAALVALAQLDPGLGDGTFGGLRQVVQGASGVAKDLPKMSSKNPAVKILAPTADGGLFRWVALLTGSKNAVKGLGFLLGAALLATLGFTAAVLAMAAVLAVILAGVLIAMPSGLPRGAEGGEVHPR